MTDGSRRYFSRACARYYASCFILPCLLRAPIKESTSQKALYPPPPFSGFFRFSRSCQTTDCRGTSGRDTPDNPYPPQFLRSWRRTSTRYCGTELIASTALKLCTRRNDRLLTRTLFGLSRGRECTRITIISPLSRPRNCYHLRSFLRKPLGLNISCGRL